MSPIKLDLSKIYDNWPISLSLLILGITIIILFILSIRMNNGHFTYVMDDPYIHMAIAKHFVQTGTWGVTIYGFSSSASSIIWPLMLSGIYYMAGVNEITPFILNIIFGFMILTITYYILKSRGAPPKYNFIVLFFLTFVTPLPMLIFLGMEHISHILLSISFIYIATVVFTQENKNNLNYYILIILAVLLTMVRYEGLFIIAVVSILFLIRRRYTQFLTLLGVSLIPIIVYGIISMVNGWQFLPNSLLAKSSLLYGPNVFSLKFVGKVINIFLGMKTSSIIIISLPILYFIIQTIKKKDYWSFTNVLTTIFIFSTLIHLSTVSYSWFYRHDAYIIALGILTISLIFNDYIKRDLEFKFYEKDVLRYIAVILLIFALMSPFASRAYSTVQIPAASHAVYDQQYQMGLFLKEYYQGDSVAANDMGAINYLADIKVIDSLGLANKYIPTHLGKTAYRIYLENITAKENAKVIIVYDFMLKKEIPRNWIKVGEWKIPKKMFSGNETISFYAINSQDEKELIKNLKSYSSKLPEDVKQNGKYTQ